MTDSEERERALREAVPKTNETRIARLNYRHEAIVNWLIANPNKTLGECSREMGYTQSWLSSVIHSDMFQAAYTERARELGEITTHTVKDKLTRATSLALDRTIEELEGTPSDRFIEGTTRNLLSIIDGGRGKEKEGDKHLHFHVDASLLDDAKKQRRQLIELSKEQASEPA